MTFLDLAVSLRNIVLNSILIKFWSFEINGIKHQEKHVVFFHLGLYDFTGVSLDPWAVCILKNPCHLADIKSKVNI